MNELTLVPTLIFLGKFQKPRCFKNVKTLPVEYCGNKKAWMTSAIFENYLKSWDSELIKQKRKILLIVDNCPAHPDVKLRNIKLHFFPPNATSVLQPMDQGVIRSLKQFYRKQMLLKIMELQESSITKAISILEGINLLSFAWETISSETIRNCFRHAGLVKSSNESVDCDQEDNLPLSDWLRIQNMLDSNKFDDYINIDEEVITTEELSDNDLMKQLQNQEETDEELQDDEEAETVVTTEEALGCIRKLKNFFQQEDVNDEIFSNLNKIHLLIQNKYIANRQVQTKITDFFKN